MAENEGSRSWSHLINPMAMLGLSESKPDRQQQAEAQRCEGVPDESGYEILRGGGSRVERDAAQHPRVHDRTEFRHNSASPITVDAKDHTPSNQGGAQLWEHVSTVYSQHGGIDGRQKRGNQLPSDHGHAARSPEHQMVEMLNIINTHEAALRMRDKEMDVLRYQIQELGLASFKWEQQCHCARAELDAARRQIDHQIKLLDEAHHRCERGDAEFRKLKELLDHRTEEVKVAQAFMTTADKYSVAEVSQMVEELNDEIYQCSMDVSDAMLGQDLETEDSGDAKRLLEEAQSAFQRWDVEVVKRLGVDLNGSDPDTTLFDCMVQNSFAIWCHQIVRAFCLQNKAADKYLSDLWEEVAASHETSIARNWLAMTHTTLKAREQPLDRTLLMKRLANVMTLCGRKSLPRNRLEDIIGRKLEQMEKKALKVKEAIAEGVLSAEIEVFLSVMNKEFHPTEMRNAFENPGRTPRSESTSRVVCPTGLGMRRITRERSASDGLGMRRRREVVLKTKVLLYSAPNE